MFQELFTNITSGARRPEGRSAAIFSTHRHVSPFSFTVPKIRSVTPFGSFYCYFTIQRSIDLALRLFEAFRLFLSFPAHKTLPVSADKCRFPGILLVTFVDLLLRNNIILL